MSVLSQFQNVLSFINNSLWAGSSAEGPQSYHSFGFSVVDKGVFMWHWEPFPMSGKTQGPFWPVSDEDWW